MAWYNFVSNSILNIVIWFCIFFWILIMSVAGWFLQDWLRSDTLIFINKDGSISTNTRVIKKDERIAGKIQKGKHTYTLDPLGVHTVKTFPQWKKIYVFDEGCPMPRRLNYRKDYWFSTETITKVLNDTRLKMLTKEPIDANTKLFIMLGAIGGLLACLSSGIVLLLELGIIGGN